MQSTVAFAHGLAILGLLVTAGWCRAEEPFRADGLPPLLEPHDDPVRLVPSIRDPVIPPLPSPTQIPAAPGPRAEGAPPVAPAPINSVESIQPGDRERRKFKTKADVAGGATVASEFIFRAPEPTRDTPFERGEWSNEELIHVPVTGPIYVFGQVNLNGEYAANQEMRVVGRTGLSYRVPYSGKEFELRGGPSIKVADALGQEPNRDATQFLLEVQCRTPLLGPLGFEYDGAALPAMTPFDRPELKQDFGLALPVQNGGGKFKVGAKQKWQGTGDSKLRAGLMELYIGLEINR